MAEDRYMHWTELTRMVLDAGVATDEWDHALNPVPACQFGPPFFVQGLMILNHPEYGLVRVQGAGTRINANRLVKEMRFDSAYGDGERICASNVLGKVWIDPMTGDYGKREY